MHDIIKKGDNYLVVAEAFTQIINTIIIALMAVCFWVEWADYILLIGTS